MEGLSKMERQDWSGAFLQIILSDLGQYLAPKHNVLLAKIDVREFFTGSHRQPAAASGSDVNPAAQSHPSSRAGGQDYVSSKQTPSN